MIVQKEKFKMSYINSDYLLDLVISRAADEAVLSAPETCELISDHLFNTFELSSSFPWKNEIYFIAILQTW